MEEKEWWQGLEIPYCLEGDNNYRDQVHETPGKYRRIYTFDGLLDIGSYVCQGLM